FSIPLKLRLRVRWRQAWHPPLQYPPECRAMPAASIMVAELQWKSCKDQTAPQPSPSRPGAESQSQTGLRRQSGRGIDITTVVQWESLAHRRQTAADIGD